MATSSRGHGRIATLATMRYVPITLAVTTLVLLGAACSDDAGDVVDQAQEKVGEAGARAAAEALRATLKTENDDLRGGLCNAENLQDAVDKLPGDVEVTGIDDRDDDGVDDDCYLQVTVGDQSACVTVPRSGTDVDVNGGDCPRG